MDGNLILYIKVFCATFCAKGAAFVAIVEAGISFSLALGRLSFAFSTIWKYNSFFLSKCLSPEKINDSGSSRENKDMF